MFDTNGDRKRLSRPVFFALWGMLVVAFVLVVALRLPIILIVLIAAANLVLLWFMPRKERGARPRAA